MIPKRRIIPVFVPHLGCPNDCVFCNQRRISGQLQPATAETVAVALNNAAQTIDGSEPVQVAFYGGSFTAIPVREQNNLLDAAKAFLERFDHASIRISTRPDAIDGKTLSRLKDRGVVTIELGAQSMDDAVLSAAGRGHTACDTVQAARMIKEAGFELILQMMTSLPGDTHEKSLQTANHLIALRPDGVRVYPTVVIGDTRLHDLWTAGTYSAPTIDESVALCADISMLFEKAQIPIIRMGLNPTEDLTAGAAAAGAYHPAFGELVMSRVCLHKMRELLNKIDQANVSCVVFGAASGQVSRVVGHKRTNMKQLSEEFAPIRFRVSETGVQPGEIVILSIENTL